MKDFNKGKIYVVRSPSTEDVYIGSTTQPLSIRMGVHRSEYNTCRSKLIIAFGNAYIELLEDWPCDNIEQLRAREGHHHRTYKNCINKYIAGNFSKFSNKQEYKSEYRKNNKDKIKENQSEYYQNNKVKILETHSEYRKNNIEKINEKHSCQCGGKYTNVHKACHIKSLKHQRYLKIPISVLGF